MYDDYLNELDKALKDTILKPGYGAVTIGFLLRNDPEFLLWVHRRGHVHLRKFVLDAAIIARKEETIVHIHDSLDAALFRRVFFDEPVLS